MQRSVITIFHPNRILSTFTFRGLGLTILAACWFLAGSPAQMQAQTCVFNSVIRASDKPFDFCPVGTDTIIIRDSFSIDQSYEPILGGVPFQGLFIVDGGVVAWNGNTNFKLGFAARLVLINGGILRPAIIGQSDCNSARRLLFDTEVKASCSGIGAPHAFTDVNLAGCIDVVGICCTAYMNVEENSGNPDDGVLCAPGDSAQISVSGSGSLNYQYLWNPNLGSEPGPYVIKPPVTTTYSVNISGVFVPYIGDPYVLTCAGSTKVTVNSVINLTATANTVPCQNVPTGTIDLSVSGGTAPYRYLWSNSDTTQDLSNLVAGAYSVTVTDRFGCTGVRSVTVAIVDLTPPSITCPPNAIDIADPGLCTTRVSGINAVFSDNCPTVGLFYQLTGATNSSGAGQLSDTIPFSSGVTTVLYTADDGLNQSTCSFIVTVSDLQLPTASNPATLAGIQCQSAIPPPDPAAVTDEADNCGAPTVAFVADNIISGGGCIGDTLVVERRYRVTDAFGNSILVTQQIRVVDSTPPAFTSVPANLTVNCQAIPPLGTPSASDNCGGSVNITYNGETRINGSCNDNYTLQRQWTAVDACGNTATAIQQIKVWDITPPGFSFVPQNTTVSCDAIPLPGTPVAADNCDTDVTVTFAGETRIPGACDNQFTLRREWTATDNCGNAATATQLLSVADLSQPVFTFVPPNITVDCEAVPTPGTPAASDNCDADVSIVYNGETRVNGSCAENYALIRQWTASDNCGNTRTASQVVTVRDTKPPQLLFVPNNITVNCDAVISSGTPTASDNCDATVTVQFFNEVRTDGSCPDSYTLQRQWIATDNCGNSATAEQVLTVQDTTKPIFTFTPADVTVDCNAIPTLGTPAIQDNCDTAPTLFYNGQTRINSTCQDSYTLKREWTATDNCGNAARTTQTIVVLDQIPPQFTFVPQNISVNCVNVPAPGIPTATDNCAVNVAIAYNGQTRINGSCPNTYTLRREWTATDNCGNTKTAQQIIEVTDDTEPVFLFVPDDVTVNCNTIPPLETAIAADNCTPSVPVIYAGETRTDGPCADTYTLRRRWSATDECGNIQTAEQVITVRDVTPPAFNFVPANATVSCEAVPAPGTPTATDLCDANAAIAYLGEVRTDGACSDSYILLRTWSATDNCGNSATATQRITVQDLQAPVFNFVPDNITVECDDIPGIGTPTATDNCAADPTIVFNSEARIDGPCTHNYTLIRQWIATDNCGNTRSANQTITVRDQTPPALTVVPPDLTVNCDAVPPVGTPQATDNCAANVIISFDGETRTDGACPNTYLLRRAWTISDECGNFTIAEQLISVQDVTKPVFTFLPADVTVSCESVPPLETPVVADNCAGAVALQYDGETRTNGPCPDTYTLLRRWTATDVCGNVQTAEQSITVVDDTKPVFTFVPTNVTVNCNALPPVGTPEGTDNCASLAVVIYNGQTISLGNCPENYVITRTWTISDDCGNTVSATQSITVIDNISPVFTFVPADVTVNCESIPPVETPTAIDNCSTAPTVIFDGEERVDGPCANSFTLVRRWSVKDNCGNGTNAQQIISVEDISLPQFTFVPADVTVSCDDVPPPGTPLVTDNCSANLPVQYAGEQRVDGACPDSYTLRRVWMATDECGNMIAAQQTITVEDIVSPAFTNAPADVTVSCNAVPPTPTLQATDNCDTDVTVTFDSETRVDGACPDSYLLIRKWNAEDNCGNITTTQQEITVRDTEAPVFTITLPDVTVNCESVPGVGAPAATDNCDDQVTIIFVGETRTTGTCPDNYILRRTWSATDNCGNVRITAQIITVQDTTKPVFTFVPADVTVDCDNIPIAGSPTATDNCTAVVDITYLGETIMNSSSANTFTLLRRWQAKDNCGNVTPVEQVLQVQDTLAPTIQCPADISAFADAATCTAIIPFDQAVATDNCAPTLQISANASSGAAFPIGTTIVVFEAKDDSGNSVQCSFKIMVADTTKPVLSNCPPDLTFVSPDANCNAVADWTPPTVTDLCDAYPIVPQPNIPPGSVLPTGITNIVYTATDSTGNVMTCSFRVTVEETINPVLSPCPPDITLTTDSCTAIANWTPPTATDNCELAQLSANIQPGTVFQEGTTTVIYTATDAWGGNTATCSFQVTVVDIVPPTFSGCPQDTLVNSGDVCSIVINFDLPTATDNCDPTPTIFAIPASGFDFPVGFTTVRIFVEDPSGNQDTCVFKVTVVGPPLGLANTPPDQTFIACSAVATWTPPVPTGVCGPIQLISNYEPGDTFDIGVTTVVYTLTDTLNNSAQVSFTITVTESSAPVIDCPGSPIVLDVSGAILSDPDQFVVGADTVSSCDGVKLRFFPPTATDNCDPPQLQQLSDLLSGAVFSVGNHTIVYQAKDDAGNTALCTITVQIKALEPLNPIVSDAIGCPGDDITLSAPVFPGAIYTWNGPQAPYPNSSTLLITDLKINQTGYYTVFANLNGCLTPLDSARVRIGMVPTATDDPDFEIEPGGLLEDMNVLLNDIYESDDFIVTLETDLAGLTELGNGLFEYQAGTRNGKAEFYYKLCSEACPDLCDVAKVIITIREVDCTYIPNIITPNGDGINDYLEIPCLDTELYPNNALIIYNQWGDQVFEAAPYSNDPLRVWRGTLNGEDGKDLPDATYFYIFKSAPDRPALKGFVELFR